MNTPHERLTRTTFSLPLGEVHALVGGAVNARPLTTFFDRMREAETHIAIPLLQLHGNVGCATWREPAADRDLLGSTRVPVVEQRLRVARPCTRSPMLDRRSSHHRCGSRADEPVHSIRRDFRL